MKFNLLHLVLQPRQPDRCGLTSGFHEIVVTPSDVDDSNDGDAAVEASASVAALLTQCHRVGERE